MAKLIKQSDGSIALQYEEGSVESANFEKKKSLLKQLKGIKGNDFKSLSQAEKDALIELLLRMHDLI